MGDLLPVIPRTLATQDVRDAAADDADEADRATARRLVDAVEQAFTLITRHPAIGSPATPSSSTCRGYAPEPSNGSPT
jgi:plasmid stabilization system protein ParE